jgi:hypothetical protein
MQNGFHVDIFCLAENHFLTWKSCAEAIESHQT